MPVSQKEQHEFVPDASGLKAIPTKPTHCRGCGVELPPLRRWGGRCKSCVMGMPHRARRADPLAVRWVIVKRFSRRRGKGITERCVRVRCECGNERVMTLAVWQQRRTLGCKQCALRGFRTRGVESDYAR
jgi:hypothetical protein